MDPIWREAQRRRMVNQRKDASRLKARLEGYKTLARQARVPGEQIAIMAFGFEAGWRAAMDTKGDV